MTDYIRYDILAQNALREVVRTVMADAAKKGLLGEHHFKISFDTTAPGVRLSPRLREQYPQEMTIVLQHQFWDLEVSDEAFEVGLSFSGIPEPVKPAEGKLPAKPALGPRAVPSPPKQDEEPDGDGDKPRNGGKTSGAQV